MTHPLVSLLPAVVLWHLTVFTTHAQVFTADQMPISKEGRASLVEEGKDKVILVDLSAPHEGNWFLGTPVCSAGKWIKLAPGRYRVRHRLAVDRVGAANVSVWSEVLGSTREKGHARVGWARWLGVDFAEDNAYQNCDTLIDLPVEMEVNPQLLWRRSTKEPGDIQKIRIQSIEILPAKEPLVVSDVLANKVHYREGEEGSGYAKVLNGTETEQKGKLVVRLLTDVETTGAVVHEKEITVPAHAEQEVKFAFPTLRKYGYELRAEIQDPKGQALDRRADYFTASNNVLEVGIGAGTPFRDLYVPYPTGFKGSPDEFSNWCRSTSAWVAAARRGYNRTMELFAWGPADCIKLVPPTEDFLCGQCKYPQSVSRTKFLIDECHKYGMTVQLYIQSLYGCGDGGQYLQDHPEYYAYNADGRPQGFNIRCPEPVDDHVQGLLKSIEMFGWDGARWDGHFDFCPPYDNLKTLLGEKIDTSNRDQLVADINDKIRKAINGKYPLFTWGHNWNDQVENFTDSKEMASLCANGAWIMNEGIKDSENPTSGTHRWTDFAKRLASGNRLVRAKGGLYLIVAPPQYFQAGSQVLYKTILTFAARSYLYGGTFYDREPMGYDLAAFLTRYARYVWSREFVDTPSAEPLVSVQPGDKIWWKDYLSQKVEKDHVEQILGLVNPPVAEGVTTEPNGALPAVQKNIQVVFNVPKGMKSAKATLLAPENKPFQQDLPVKLADGKAAVTVPQLRYWCLVHMNWSK